MWAFYFDVQSQRDHQEWLSRIYLITHRVGISITSTCRENSHSSNPKPVGSLASGKLYSSLLWKKE